MSALDDAKAALVGRPDLRDLERALRTLIAEHERVLAHPLLSTVDMEATALIELPDDELPGMWSRSDFTGGQDEADAILAKRRELRAEAEVLIEQKSEYAEQHGHPTFQDEGTAFIEGYVAGAEREAG